MKIEIIKSNGKWLVNGKPYTNSTDKEKIFFGEFLIAMKWEEQCQEFDKKQDAIKWK